MFISKTVQNRKIETLLLHTSNKCDGSGLSVSSFPVVFRVIHLLQAFLIAICQSFVSHLSRFELTVHRAVPL